MASDRISTEEATSPQPDDYDWLDVDPYEPSDEDELEFDCHMGPDGQCGAAGSETCDFECPTMRELREQWRREDAKHGQ